jgi:hypothetical protein
MKEYDVALADNPSDLHENVTEMIRNGWEPLGGVAVSHWSENVGGQWYKQQEYAQAMVREKKP